VQLHEVTAVKVGGGNAVEIGEDARVFQDEGAVGGILPPALESHIGKQAIPF